MRSKREDPVWPGNIERLQHDGLQHTKHNHIGCYAQRQDEDRGGGKARRTAYMAKGEAKIPQDRVHGQPPDGCLDST
jgi:hypothetical protein